MRQGIRLGVDVGSVRVGLAASDPGGVLATPVETIERDLLFGADLGVIAAAVLERHVLEVVVGLPRSLSGDEGPSAQGARAYAVALANRISPTPVRLVDERLTTIDAHRQLRDSGMAGRAQRAVVDQAAAVLILQAALDAEKSSGRAAGELVGRRKVRAPRTKAKGSQR
ncbi:MAG TPA: Holliday junction resolvase RuvX [Dermatophilaceae bacterium]